MEMLVRAVAALHALHERQLGLNAMEQPVKDHLLACIWILLGEHPQGKGEPTQPAPGDGAVCVTSKGWWRPLRLRLACGTRSGRCVEDHHRTTERHTPQAARVSLAELRRFLEIALGELRLDLRFHGR